MKKNLILSFLVCLFSLAVFSQKTTLHINIANTGSSECIVALHSSAFMWDYLKKGYVTIPLNVSKTAVYSLNITQPEFITLYCDSAGRQTKLLKYTFFVSPGDDLYFKADFKQADLAFKVNGIGSSNNQPLASGFFERDFGKFRSDTLPNRVIAAINEASKSAKAGFATYIKKYNPSAMFVKNMQHNVNYYAVNTYYNFKENNKYAIEEAYYRNKPQWDKVTDSLFAVTKLNNGDALYAPNYLGLANFFLLRKKEELWRQSNTDSAAFYKQWYNADVEAGKNAFTDDRSNLLQEKIINNYFTGATAEYLYGVLFDNAFAESDPKNIPVIFNRFKHIYPNSKYIGWFEPSVRSLILKNRNVLTNEMVFVKDNGTKLNTLEDVLSLAKGKTVLLDMWGTWCGPCRSEMDKHSEAIKAYFKNKGLDYLYVANYDVNNERAWKKLIAYFKLSGTHILANGNLSDDIMKKVKGRGYPTYIVIKKDGSYELSKADYPMKRDVLIKQLEDALASNF